MLTVDLGAAAPPASRRCPWVAAASACTADWPGTVRIDVAERAPVAGYLADGRRLAASIDDDGPRDRRPRRPADRLPGHRADRPGHGGRPAGARASRRRRRIADAGRLVAGLPDDLRAEVASVGATRRASWSSTCARRAPCCSARSTELRDKLVGVLAVLDDVDPTAIGTLDVRAPANPGVRPACESLTRLHHECVQRQRRVRA